MNHTVSQKMAAWMTALGVLVGLAGCERPAARSAGNGETPLKKLIILTPHNEAIRNAFAAGFAAWELKNRNAQMHIEWIYLGAPQCVQYMLQIPMLQAQGARWERPDLMFGGGIADFNKLAAAGALRKVEPAGASDTIPAEVFGQPTRDKQGRWYAMALASFGIVYNDRACQERGIAPPTTWTDLADPRFYGWVGLADPTNSGSNREGMVLILQHEGWEQGWSTLMRILANARALGSRSGDVLGEVKNGVFLAALAVNSDGMAMAAASNGAIKYIDPPGASAASLDLVAVMSTTTNAELAKEFISYVLSEEGQALWGVSEEYRQPLYHYPISPAIYEKHAGNMSVPRNPLTTEFGPRIDWEKADRQGWALRTFVEAACGSNHVALQRVWKAVIDAGMPAEAVKLLCAPPIDEAAALELGAKLEQATQSESEATLKEWTAKFAERYEKLRAMLNVKP